MQTPLMLSAASRLKTRWLTAAYALILGVLMGLSWSARAQEGLVISDVRFDDAGRPIVRAAHNAGTYSVLYRGHHLEAINTPTAIQTEASAADPTVIELPDSDSPFGHDVWFYRVTQAPVSAPLDVDGDGLDDLYELENRDWLDPLHPHDALYDHDHDYVATLDEVRSGANPFLYDASALAETLYQMPTNAPFDPTPEDRTKSLVQKLLVYAYDTDNNTIPVKRLTIRNNNPFTIYPVMRDGNEAAQRTDPNVGVYDPYDPVRTEYRGYIGYQGADNKFYFGLRSNAAITIRIPLVFWNGARMGIVTDGQYLTPAVGKPNPLHYDQNGQKVIVTAEHADPNDHTPPNPKTDGVVMWYRAALLAPALDSPDQLLEWTIRDREYLSSPQITARTHGEIPATEKTTLINYDVSYVDNMFLPAAMEALDVPVPAPPTPFNQNRGPYGWIGAINSGADLQAKIKAFVAPNNKLLGTYFGTNGWPFYNMPPDPSGGVKIPSGQNIFAQSPLAGNYSSYDVDNNHFMLSSGGTEPVKVNIGGQGAASSGKILSLSGIGDTNKVRMLRPGFTVVGRAPEHQANPIQPDTKIDKILHISTGPADPTTIQLDKDLVATQDGCTFDFYRPVTDYASEALIKLWYSWANYYVTQTQNTPAQTLRGTVATDRATLTFGAPANGLIEGMQVTGPGLDSPNPSQGKGGVIILRIAGDKKSVTLSQLARLDTTTNYNFVRPQVLPATPTGLYALNFSTDPKEPSRVPLEFAKKVYLAMASMAQIPKNPDPEVKTTRVLELMLNVVGGNMGFIFDTNARRFSADGLRISAVIRDIIKSLLRGVTDFTVFPEYDTNKKQVWYPDPRVARSGLPFNAYNLDPFVWFVHVTLGFSGYGFSLDDDTADVGAGEATRLLMTVGGPRGLPNTNEWTIQAVYGPVTGQGDWDSSKRVSFTLAITGASNRSPIVITSVKNGLAEGERVIIDQVQGNTAANGTWTVANVTENTFELVGSTGNGDYTSGGRWTRGPLPYVSGFDKLNVYWKLKGDDRQAGFTGAIVSGPGVQKAGSVRIVQLGNDQQAVLALNTNLVNADGTVLANGRYTWTFSGK